MTYDVYDTCSDCKEAQQVEIKFDAVHPITNRIFTVRYCKHIDMILTNDIAHSVGKIGCPFPQKAREL